jgi:hypothetical protein
MGGEIAVPLELFFNENSDESCIGCNLGDERPSTATFFKLLATLQARPEVQGIWMRICDWDESNSWPFSDTAYVLTSLSESDIRKALAELIVGEVSEGWLYGKPAAAPVLAPGFVVFSLWWD